MPFLAPFVAAFTLIAAVVPAFTLPGSAADPRPPYPAPPGYLLPWIGGTAQAVTQGEETTLTHNGLGGYAFDFDLSYAIVVAARAGRVAMVRQDSQVGGCGAAYAGDANYVVIDHGDGTSALYLHLAPAAVLVTPGQYVEQGQAVAVSGESGLTCRDDRTGPAPHLHFQVERTDEGHAYTQSLPIAFDDIAGNGGVPREGASYVSGNAGHGRRPPFSLTPHHEQRPFHPLAVPADPSLTEGVPATATPAAANTPPPATRTPAGASPTPEPTMTPRPTRTPTPRPTYTPTATATPAPSATATSAPSTTATPAPAPSATVTATPAPPATATPAAPSATVTAAPSATAAPAPPPPPPPATATP